MMSGGDHVERAQTSAPGGDAAARLAGHNERIRAHFEALAETYPALKRRNRYYNDYLVRFCRAIVPPGRRVLDVGCGRGDVLAAVRPASGLGIDLSQAMVDRAARDNAAHAGLEFKKQAIEELAGDGSFDAALIINTLEYMYDIGAVLDRVHAALRDNGRLLISTANPVWSPIFKAASAVGLRIPECERLFITNEDLVNMLQLHGFDVVHKSMDLLIPKRVAGVGGIVDAVNWAVSRTPIVHLLSSTQLIAVSAVVPCYNEEGNVGRCVTEMKKLGARTELIFVDDGSKDGTAAAVKTAIAEHARKDVDVKLVSYTPNAGKANAVQRGFEAATGDIVFILDADLTTHPEELPAMYEAFANGRAEFVNCTRFVYPMEGAAMKYANYVGNKAFAIAVSIIMGRRVSDTLCGTKALFRWDYAHFTMGRDPWGDYDFLFGAAQMRLVLRELPVHYRDRLAGLSKMNSMKHTKNLLKMCVHGFKQVQLQRALPDPNPAVAARAPIGTSGTATGKSKGARAR
jgi:2-polyprenyl-3-methyl-5-hydroxy-6-metoxy-1,4-benzoquinol methylase